MFLQRKESAEKCKFALLERVINHKHKYSKMYNIPITCSVAEV